MKIGPVVIMRVKEYERQVKSVCFKDKVKNAMVGKLLAENLELKRALESGGKVA
jgi:hypothetical protein